MSSKVLIAFKCVILFLMGLVPLVWSTQVNANYFTTKSFVVYVVGALCWLYLILSDRHFRFSFIKNKVLLIALLVSVFLQFVYAFVFLPERSFYYIQEVISFYGLFLFILNQNLDLKDDIKTYLMWFFCCIVFLSQIITIYDAVAVYNNPLNSDLLTIIMPFGNINMVSEFYLFTLPFLVLIILKTLKNKWLNLFSQSIFFISVVLNVYLLSRSVWISLFAFSIALFLLKLNKKIVGLFLMAILFGTVALKSSLYFNPSSVTDGGFKALSNDSRVNLYQSAWHMLLAKPWGVGLGQYEDHITPYRTGLGYKVPDMYYPDHPHSEYFKWAAQFGFIGLILSLIITVLFLVVGLKSKNTLLILMLFAASGQLLFQFPFENPSTVVLIAIGLGISLSKEFDFQKRHLRIHPIKGLFLLFFVIQSFYAIQFITSIRKESAYPNDLKLTQEACKDNPIYLKGCVAQFSNYLNSGLFVHFKDEIQKEMKYRPYVADYLRLLVMYYQKNAAKEPQASRNICEILKVYTSIYEDQSFVKLDEMSKCNMYINPISTLNPLQLEKDYTNWLDQLFKR